MYVIGILEKLAIFAGRKVGREIFLVLPPRKALISLESTPQKEGKGNVWKGLSGLSRTQSQFDWAWLPISGA